MFSNIHLKFLTYKSHKLDILQIVSIRCRQLVTRQLVSMDYAPGLLDAWTFIHQSQIFNFWKIIAEKFFSNFLHKTQ